MIAKLNLPNYSGTLLSVPPAAEHVAQVVRDYECMVLTGLEAILRRCEARPDYGFVDTKLNLITGCDFPAEDPIRGRGMIYGWIQGRALESLAGHYYWLQAGAQVEPALQKELLDRIQMVLERLVDRLAELRRNSKGRLFFMMSPAGQALKLDEQGQVVPHQTTADAPANFTDLFYAKGLVAAATLLKDQPKIDESAVLFARVMEAIEKNEFVSDQQPLDPKNSATVLIPGRHSLGPRMIAVGGASIFLQSTGELRYQALGLRLIDYILQHHTDQTGTRSDSQRYDVWEYVDDERQPYVDADGVLLSDPGHVCEFVGLSLKFLRVCETATELSSSERGLFTDRRTLLIEILKKNFSNGFSSKGFGIGKAYDLAARQMVNSDMPWWSLPETLRATLEAGRLTSNQAAEPLREIAVNASNAFIRGYVRSDVHLMAVQALKDDGAVSTAIPATPDADPAYHTGLSIIDCLYSYDRRGLLHD